MLLLYNYSLGEADTVGLHIFTYRYGLQSERSEVQNSTETPLVFVRKGIRNVKCYVALVQSLVRKRGCSGRNTLNQHV